MDVYLIRHTPVAVPSGTCYGASDIELALGWPEELERIRGKLPLARLTGDNLYTSPLKRCRTLAQSLHPGAKPNELLREMDFGEWELKPWGDIPREHVEAWLADLENVAAPGGESLADVYARGAAFLRQLEAEAHEIAFVMTHGGMLRCLLAHALGLPLGNADRLQIDYGGVSKIRLEGPRVRIDWINR